MAVIVTRAGKGSPLTNTELDSNFVNINNEVGDKQDTLLSGTNIKTLNGDSILGSGNLDLSGGLEYVVKTTNYTASDKQGVLTDTSGGAFTITLPPTPAAGAQVVVADAGGAWGTNNLTVARNGSTISGLAENLVCDISGAAVQLLYDGTTWGVYAQIGGNGGTAVTLDGVQTLTNKTIAFADNTLTGVAGVTATQTLTNKTLTSPTITTPAVSDPTATGAIYDNGSVRANVVAVSALDIDCTLGNYFTKTISDASTFTFSNAPSSRSYAFTLELTHTSGAVTWPTEVKWPTDTAPSLTTGKTHLFMFVTDDGGSRWRGAALVDYVN
jgi:hypothetical protein